MGMLKRARTSERKSARTPLNYARKSAKFVGSFKGKSARCFNSRIKDGVKFFMTALTILWIFLHVKLKQPSIVKENASNNVVINSELTMLPENLCCIWTTTRDVKQRKFNYPRYYLYGLNLNIHCKLLHLFLLILLGGDIATNPGPISSSKTFI